MPTLKFDTNLTNDHVFHGMMEKANEYSGKLRDVMAAKTYEEHESSINLPSDTSLLDTVRALAERKGGGDLRYHIVVGIGGSNLGTKAVYDALHGSTDLLEPNAFPKLLFAETTDPEWLAKAARLFETVETPEQILVSVISKSGGTTETMANFEILMAPLAARFDDIRDRVVAITDEGSALWKQAGELGIDRLAIPKPVGGRYSVLSAVGLFPLATVGVDINALLEGAAFMRDHCLDTSNMNAAALSATLLAFYKERGKTINDNFFFHPELESLGKWYRQLMGESIGKAESLDGRTINNGLTPTVSLGSTDLHSVGQLYLGGPKDKFTTFVYTKEAADVRVPETRLFPGLTPMINGKTAADIMNAILEGVKVAYTKADLPFMEIVLNSVSEREIGAYLQFKMLEMMYLAQLLGVNAFDQPSVESYKVETKRILG